MLKSNQKVKYLILGLVLISLSYGIVYGLSYLRIATSYAAKITCSCHFISGRNVKDIVDHDLYAVDMVQVEVDEVSKLVTSSFFGLAKKVAFYREGIGCTLLNDVSANELSLQPSPKTKVIDTVSLLVRNLPLEVDSLELMQVIDEAFTELDISKPMKNTRAIVILHDGKVVVERYAKGYHKEMPLLGWSMTKSVTNAMLGILVKQKSIDIYQPTGIKEWQTDDRKKITLNDLLQMQSGLDFEERYDKVSDATKMLFNSKSSASVALKSTLIKAPSSFWSYSSGTTNILQEFIRRSFGSDSEYIDMPYNALFIPLGMASALMERDPSGTYIGSSFMYATARDWAKFGQLYLQDGVWNGVRILPEGWVKYSSTANAYSDGEYGAQFWMNRKDKSYPQDAYCADGFEGQNVNIIPSKKLVIVRMGLSRNSSFNNEVFVKKVVGVGW